jgi:hemerythrin-like domain-containing protein
VSKVSRRGLLVAGAGLVVGAGLTEAGNALADDGKTVAARPASPGESLMTEHGVLKRLLLAYLAASAQLADGKSTVGPPVAAAASIIADYIEGFHEGLEEAYVFPRVQATHADLVRTLLTQHDRGRHLTAAISAGATGSLTSEPARLGLQRNLDLFVRMYAPHEAWEDTVIFPSLRATTRQRTLDELAERFAELEQAQYGADALAQMLDRVVEVEQQLGIGDLAAFTPSSA